MSHIEKYTDEELKNAGGFAGIALHFAASVLPAFRNFLNEDTPASASLTAEELKYFLDKAHAIIAPGCSPLEYMEDVDAGL